MMSPVGRTGDRSRAATAVFAKMVVGSPLLSASTKPGLGGEISEEPALSLGMRVVLKLATGGTAEENLNGGINCEDRSGRLSGEIIKSTNEFTSIRARLLDFSFFKLLNLATGKCVLK
jgi:hypothetical protein